MCVGGGGDREEGSFWMGESLRWEGFSWYQTELKMQISWAPRWRQERIGSRAQAEESAVGSGSVPSMWQTKEGGKDCMQEMRKERQEKMGTSFSSQLDTRVEGR